MLRVFIWNKSELLTIKNIELKNFVLNDILQIGRKIEKNLIWRICAAVETATTPDSAYLIQKW